MSTIPPRPRPAQVAWGDGDANALRITGQPKLPPGLRLRLHGRGAAFGPRTVDMERAKRPPITIRFLRGMVQAVPMLQARLPYFPSLDRRPHPTVSPPGPASGPRDGGNGRSMREGFGGGDKFFCGGNQRCWWSGRFRPQSGRSGQRRHHLKTGHRRYRLVFLHSCLNLRLIAEKSDGG